MENSKIVVKVASPSFSANKALTSELLGCFPNAVINSEGIRYSGESLKMYLKDADAAVIGLESVDDALLSECPRLRFIAKYGVGLDNIDQKACKKHGVEIGWTGGVNKRSVAEQALCFMLGMARNIFFSYRKLSNGEWRKDGGFQLTSKTVGIIGAGHTGKEVAKLLQPFGCKILVNDIVDQSEFYSENGMIEADKSEIYAKSDFITLHVPLTDDTFHLINSGSLSQMKRSAYLLNLSRGEVVDQSALKQALINEQIAGAALDVYESEPPTDIEFLRLPNLVCTPHIGGNAVEAVYSMGSSALEHLKGFYLL